MLDTYPKVKKILKNDKQTQVNSHLLREYEPKTPPSSSDEGGESFLSSSVKTGFRLAECTVNVSTMGANLTMAVSDTIADLITAPHHSSEEEEQQNNPEAISVQSSPPQTINSSSSDVGEVPPVIQISSSSSSTQAPSSSHQVQQVVLKQLLETKITFL